jgi:DNA damage-binding protein 1
MEPNEMILSMVYANMGGSMSGAGARPYLLVGTAFVHPDEDEPTRGRIVVYSVTNDDESHQATRKPRRISELVVRGGVYSMCQFYGGKVLATVNSKMQVCQLKEDVGGSLRLSFLGIGHHGHLLSLFVKSKAGRQPLVAASSSDDMLPDDKDDEEDKKPSAASDQVEQLAIVGDLMRSISLVRYYPEHEALEEIARDFNANWTTAVEMLTDDIYVGAENWNNIFVLRRNTKAQAEEVRCRLETVGEYHLGEMCNKFMTGSLVMPHSTSGSSVGDGRRKVAALRTTSPAKKSVAFNAANTSATTTTSRIRRPAVTIGSQTLFATTDGTLGAILGLDARTAVFFTALQRAMGKVIRAVGDLSHAEFRTFEDDRRVHPANGFVDGDLVESFLDLDCRTMESVVEEMNRDGRWDIDYQNLPSSEGKDAGEDEDDVDMGNNEHELAVEDVLAMVEEMALQH